MNWTQGQEEDGEMGYRRWKRKLQNSEQEIAFSLWKAESSSKCKQKYMFINSRKDNYATGKPKLLLTRESLRKRDQHRKNSKDTKFPSRGWEFRIVLLYFNCHCKFLLTCIFSIFRVMEVNKYHQNKPFVQWKTRSFLSVDRANYPLLTSNVLIPWKWDFI